MATDPTRRRQVLRLAAQYVERKAKGEPVTWATDVRITRLDAEGNPTGPPVQAGPIIFSGEWYGLPDPADKAAADQWQGAPGLSDAD